DARGRSRSIPVSYLVKRVDELFAGGVREAVLTGVHIGDYEDEGGLRIEDLMTALVEKTKMPRFRLSSLEPVELSPRMLDFFADGSRFCPHFHMSIQSANTKVLADMKRNYSALDVETALKAIDARVPRAFVGMDVIVGFPGETDEEFEDTFKRLQSLPWTRIHVFPYSSRPGTKAAARTDMVHPLKIKERSKRLRMLSAERHFERASAQVGTRKSVLGLKDGNGLSRDYWSVAGAFQASAESTVQITGVHVASAERITLLSV
ncbi:MAG: radical SAM protein, partial [Bdellovibrionia bacterium]